MESTQTGHIQIGIINWHVRIFGNPTLPKIFCLHGMFGDSQDWAILHSCLENKLCLMAIDFPAHGKTLLPENLTREKLLESLTALIKQQDVIAVIGYSMGGRLLLQIMDQLESSQTSIQHYYILSADPGLSHDSQHPKRLEHDLVLLKSWIEGKESAEAFFRQWYASPLFAGRFFENKWTNFLLSTRLKLNPTSLAKWVNISSSAVFSSPLDQVKKWQHKISYLVGAKDTKYLNYATELAAQTPSINIIELPDAYHGLLWESPNLLTKILLKY